MHNLAPTELILTPDGRIYHLGLHPDELAPLVITVGDPGRVARVSRHFDRLEVQTSKREFITHTGWLGPQRLSVVSTGIGPDNIDIVMNELDALINLDFTNRQPRAQPRQLHLLRLGTTGALQPDLPPDTLVVGALALGLDNLLAFYPPLQSMAVRQLAQDWQHQFADLLPIKPYSTAADALLLDTWGRDLAAGITLTAPGFYGPRGRSLRLPSQLTTHVIDQLAQFHSQGQRVVNFEMETAALYGLAELLGHRALAVNVVIANRATKTFSADPARAIDAMITKLLERITATPSAG